MPTMATRVTLPASTSVNGLANTQFEMLTYLARIQLAVQADATGVLATFQTGSDIVQEESPVQLGTINVQPKYPDDFFLEDIVAPGEKINLKLRDTSGAQRIVMIVAKVTPILV